MPVYLLHGFRWPRGGFTGIRVHIIIHNLDDCSAEYIQNASSQAELLKSFRKAYPEIMKELDPSSSGDGKGIQFLEQYDPEDELGDSAASQPFAFVGDKVVMIAGGHPAPSAGSGGEGTVTSPASNTTSESATPASAKRSSKGSVSAGIAAAAALKTQALSLNVEDVIAGGPGVTAAAWEAFADLRDKIAPGEKIGWWVVYNGDPERPYDSEDDEDYEGDEENYEEEAEEGVVTEKAEAGSSGQLTQLSQPPFPVAERTRPPQPTPKPPMFEQSDPNRGNLQPAPLSPLRSPPMKSSGKRQPGMKALPQQSTHQQPTHQQPTHQQQGAETTKPRVAPKSESLKKKLFGKRG
jgi:hypothetical protein